MWWRQPAWSKSSTQLVGMVDFCLVCSGMQPVLGSGLCPGPLPQAGLWGDGVRCVVLPRLCELRACLQQSVPILA